LTYDEQKQWASDVLDDMRLALQRKRRIRTNYIKHGAVEAAAEMAEEIAKMEEELRHEQELFDLKYS
jgi:hypothetical protein